ncbi:MAG: hypothetical protein H0X37_24040 [Herpetosiphonaceae bacterium]|nr:hypothetical protein [Herpetosiphonaceae bacterium]
MNAKQVSIAVPRALHIARLPGWCHRDIYAVIGIIGLALVGLIVAFGSTATLNWSTLGKTQDVTAREPLFLQHFYDQELSNSKVSAGYRWSKRQSLISFPGLGLGWWQTTLVLSGQRPASSPSTAILKTTGQDITLLLTNTARHYNVLLPATRGNLIINLASPGFVPHQLDPQNVDARRLGVALHDMSVAPAWVSWLPPPTMSWLVIVTLLLSYTALRVTGLRASWAIAVPLAMLLLLLVGLQQQRLVMGPYLPRLFVTGLVGVLLIAVVRLIAPRLFRVGGVKLSPPALTGLLLIIYVGYLLKASGLVWPSFLPIDIEWHMEKTRRILAGRLAELWRADSPFHQSVMPTLWGSDKPVIPYTPFYHMFSTIWAILPWRLETSANIFSAVIDSLRPLFICFMVLKFGFRERAAIVGGLVYTLIPATFLLHAWGNTPTTNGMWWSLLAITLLVGCWEHLTEQRWSWLILLLILTATMLFYAVTAVFTTLLFMGVIIGLYLVRLPRQAWPIALILALAVIVSTGIYYWQFIGPILVRTIPHFTSSIEQGGKDLGVTPLSWPMYLWKYVYLLDIYGMYLPLTLGIAGWWLGIRKLGTKSLFTPLMTSWMVIAILFWLVGFRVDMVDKQLFWLMPWMAIGTGIIVDWLLAQHRVARWALPLLLLGALYLGSDTLYFWLFRIHHNQNFTSWYQLLRQVL